jgi:hypothetical protein
MRERGIRDERGNSRCEDMEQDELDEEDSEDE